MLLLLFCSCWCYVVASIVINDDFAPVVSVASIVVMLLLILTFAHLSAVDAAVADFYFAYHVVLDSAVNMLLFAYVVVVVDDDALPVVDFDFANLVGVDSAVAFYCSSCCCC